MGTEAFKAARDFLFAHRTDYKTAQTEFRWTQLTISSVLWLPGSIYGSFRCCAEMATLSTSLYTGGIFWAYLRTLEIKAPNHFTHKEAGEITWEKMGIIVRRSLARRCSTTELHPQS